MKEQDCEQLTLFQEDSLASRLALPGSDEAVKMTVTSGLKCCELLKNSGPLGLLVRMLLESSTWHSTLCYLTWKTSATPSKRLLFRLAARTPRTKEKGALLWHTPGAQDAEGRGTYATYEAYKTGRIDKGKQISLTNQVKFPQLWPTPTTGAGLCGGSGSYQQVKNLEKQGVVTEEEKKSMVAGNGGQLNPDWVCAMMGFPPGWLNVDEDGQTEHGKMEYKE